jgi:uncharacterized repeat protein (TIGR02543 family)
MVDEEIFAVDTIAYGDTIALIAEPTQEGYTFSGWSEVPEIMPAEDIVVTGSFVINTYTITYVVDSVVYAIDSITYGDTIALLDEPTQEGYTFSGWSDAPVTMPAEDIIIEGSLNVNYYALKYIVDNEPFATDSLAYGDTIILREEPQKEDSQTKDEWIWVNGYKATDKDMKCRDYQYEMNKQFDMPEDAEISICSSGFHLCTDLGNTFAYYGPHDDNRYFHVRALVRKSDYVILNVAPTPGSYASLLRAFSGPDTKLAAKSIEFVSEVSREEFEHALIERYGDAGKLSPEFLAMVPNISIHEALQKQKTHELEEAGYPYRLAKYIMKYGDYDKAMDLATTDTITLDTKVLLACGVGSVKED